jgi:nucleoside-diphosphate-sugar epimerase
MHIVITGGAGFLASRLTRNLLQRGELTGTDGVMHAISRITLLDLAPACVLDDPRIRVVAGDISDPSIIAKAIEPDTQSIFHLAAVVSGQAEADFDLGLKVNFDATRLILERARSLGSQPRLVFTSSVAVFGGQLPQQVLDSTATTPQSSYGAQKVMGELLITDYTRKGYIDGRALRMPTIVVRPGAPNKAASSFASGIIREPLNGQSTICPVGPATRMWLMSPRKAIDNLIHGHEVAGHRFGSPRALNLPGLSISVGDMVAALESVAGRKPVDLIHWQENEAIKSIVDSWPGDFDTKRAAELGFTADLDFTRVVRAHIEEASQRS